MTRTVLCAAALAVCMTALAAAQQIYRLPDVGSMKNLTTRRSDRAPDIPGKETLMEYYMGSDGRVFTVYSFNGRKVAFSAHKNGDLQKTYRLFLDVNGDGLFQEVNRGLNWQIPRWAR